MSDILPNKMSLVARSKEKWLYSQAIGLQTLFSNLWPTKGKILGLPLWITISGLQPVAKKIQDLLSIKKISSISLGFISVYFDLC